MAKEMAAANPETNRSDVASEHLPSPASCLPQVDEAEVLRVGDMVQHIDGLRRAGPDDAYVQVMGPPASDADKWFISIIITRGCSACERLKKDWATDPWLLALAGPNVACPPRRSGCYREIHNPS